MQVQRVNNQQQRFGNVVRLEVKDPEILENIKSMARIFQCDKKAPFSFHFQESTHVTIFTGNEKNEVDKLKATEARLAKKVFSGLPGADGIFANAYNALMDAQKATAKKIQELEYGIKSMVINPAIDSKKVNALDGQL